MIAGQIIYTLLKPLVGDRIYPLIVPESQSNESPYIVYQVISSQPQNTLDGTTHHEWVRVQIDIYHKNYDACAQLSHDVVATLDQNIQISIYDGTQQLYENDTRLFRQSIDIEFWQTTPTTL